MIPSPGGAHELPHTAGLLLRLRLGRGRSGSHDDDRAGESGLLRQGELRVGRVGDDAHRAHGREVAGVGAVGHH